MNTSLEDKVKQAGKEIFQKVKLSKASFFDRSFWSTDTKFLSDPLELQYGKNMSL